jgi:hypothetical protein
MSKRSPEEILSALDDEAADAEMERILKLTPEQRRLELEAESVDLGKLEAKADAMHEEIRRAQVAQRVRELEAEARVRALRPAPSRRRMVILLAAAVVGVGVPSAILIAHVLSPSAPSPAPPPAPAPSPEPGPTPAHLRDIAMNACADHLWQTCLDNLNAARGVDPAGDADPVLQRERQKAEDAIRASFDGGPPRSDEPMRRQPP